MIRKISEKHSETLRSSVVVTSVPNIVFQLVENAAQAKSTLIQVSLRLSTWQVVCEDDGHGLAKESLEQIGQRYATSKLSSEGAFAGHQGEALCSIAECASVRIISKFSRSPVCYERSLHGEGDRVTA
eukprot:CAMPEP_0119139044 /NCGR_PEP_ID=MMETSP1310-20130426/26800_1 /TAXON_ID=464262 /ORGANISM="Genus nov. species nov., Strain RCC2339" /LENGTH=127 /DNA_ID=CAMNT_0007130301 /DNA_START=79 /DNA_END=459 /DNA_ORIENTATION=+